MQRVDTLASVTDSATVQSFKFTHSQVYIAIQKKFIDATETHDPEHISDYLFFE